MSTAGPGGRDRLISYATYYLQRGIQPEGVLEMLRERFPGASALDLAVAFGDALRQSRLAEDINELRPNQPLSDVLPAGLAEAGTVSLGVLVEIELESGIIETALVEVDVPADATLEDIREASQAAYDNDQSYGAGVVTSVEVIPPALSGRS